MNIIYGYHIWTSFMDIIYGYHINSKDSIDSIDSIWSRIELIKQM